MNARDERLASRIGSAILMPQAAFSRDLARGATLYDLAGEYEVSLEMAARRVAEVRRVQVRTWCAGKLVYLNGASWGELTLQAQDGDWAWEVG